MHIIMFINLKLQKETFRPLGLNESYRFDVHMFGSLHEKIVMHNKIAKSKFSPKSIMFAWCGPKCKPTTITTSSYMNCLDALS